MCVCVCVCVWPKEPEASNFSLINKQKKSIFFVFVFTYLAHDSEISQLLSLFDWKTITRGLNSPVAASMKAAQKCHCLVAVSSLTNVHHPTVDEYSKTPSWNVSTNALWPTKHCLIFNNVNVFVKQRKKCIKTSDFFFLHWRTYLNYLTPFEFRIVNKGIVIEINHLCQIIYAKSFMPIYYLSIIPFSFNEFCWIMPELRSRGLFNNLHLHQLLLRVCK